MVKFPAKTVDGVNIINQEAIKSLKTNGTYLPNVSRTIFNLSTEERIPVLDENGVQKTETVFNEDGTSRTDKFGNPVVKGVWTTRKLDYPVLTTTVFWADGTVTRVKNAKEDPVSLTEKKLPDGRTVTVASNSAKAQAIAYATTKRTCGIPDEKGEITATGMGKIIDDIIESAYDQNFEEASAKYRKAVSKAEYEAKKNNGKRRLAKKKYSYNDCMQMAGPILEALLNRLSENPEMIDRLTSEFAKRD